MSDNYNRGYGMPNSADSSYSKFSRSAGVSTYHNRRRQGLIFKTVIAAMLIVILGGAAVILGGHYFGNKTAAADNKEELSEKQEITTVQPAVITLVAAGDVVMNGSAVQSGLLESGAYDFDHIFANVSRELASADIRLVSQETNLPSAQFGFGNSTPLNAPQELGRAELDAGFNVILRASDHTFDNGQEGLHNELQWWDSEYPETPLLGVAEPNQEENPGLNDYVNNVYIFDKDGFKVAILNHTWGVGDENRGFISALAEDKIAADVQKARDEGASMIIACPHWGQENNTETSEEETTFSQIYANHGVDVVIGTHPRVLQRTEVLHNDEGHATVCYYSLGCLVSSLSTDNFIGGLAKVTLSRDDQGNCSVSSATLEPVVTCRANGDKYSVYPLSEYRDDIAQNGWDYLMPEAVKNRCSEILGEGFNWDENRLVIV